NRAGHDDADGRSTWDHSARGFGSDRILTRLTLSYSRVQEHPPTVLRPLLEEVTSQLLAVVTDGFRCGRVRIIWTDRLSTVSSANGCPPQGIPDRR
ncbi:MAG TPA: hypothetical protein VN648_21945, partial [Candidatus Methylomirabilis sp.]|nr:hypothetical protein [Candidatus Methylomirabilis sp.]